MAVMKQKSVRTVVINNTIMPDDLVRAVVKFAAPSGVTGVKLVHRNTSRQWGGMAYPTLKRVSSQNRQA